MQQQDFHLSFLVDNTPAEVFNAVNNVRGWWSTKLEGSSEKLQDEFIYRHGDLHYSKHRLVTVIPNEKVVWLTLDSRLTFVEKQTEWNGTDVIFDISTQDGKTKLDITHWGLTPGTAVLRRLFKRLDTLSHPQLVAFNHNRKRPAGLTCNIRNAGKLSSEKLYFGKPFR